MEKLIEMTVDEFYLLVSAVHREWKQNSECISNNHVNSIFYNSLSVHLYRVDSQRVWSTMDETKYEVKRPSGMFRRKDKNTFDSAMKLFDELKRGRTVLSVEEQICRHVACAKDIIAERALVEDGD